MILATAVKVRADALVAVDKTFREVAGIELITKKSRPFNQTEFSRRQQAIYLGQNRWFATVEGIILAKLEWAKMGNTERQFTDALNVAKIWGEALNRAYLQKWAREPEVWKSLERLFRELD